MAEGRLRTFPAKDGKFKKGLVTLGPVFYSSDALEESVR